jgi:hypothetical protein
MEDMLVLFLVVQVGGQVDSSGSYEFENYPMILDILRGVIPKGQFSSKKHSRKSIKTFKSQINISLEKIP